MKFSVVTVVYNGEKTIEQTIKSVVNQTYPDIEYIVIDGGSTDKTLEIIKKYKEKIACVISEKDEGIYDAMNKGIRMATGDVISFLNSDDWYEQGVFEKLAYYFESDSTVDIVSACPINVYEDKIIPETYWKKDVEEVHLKILYAHPATFHKKSLFDTVGLYNTKYKLAADPDWYLRAHNAGAKFLDVQEWTTYFRKNGASAYQLQKVYEEFKDSALNNMGEHESINMYNKIEKCLNFEIERAKCQDYFLKNWKNKLPVFKDKLDRTKKYYIWGCGLHGERCLKLFRALELNVVAFVESSPHIEQKDNIPVIGPWELDTECIVVIASLRYEDEIREKLCELGAKKELILSFVEIERLIMEDEL